MINVTEDKDKGCIYVTTDSPEEYGLVTKSAETYRWDQARRRFLCQKQEIFSIVNGAKSANVEINYPPELYNYEGEIKRQYKDTLSYLNSIRKGGLDAKDVAYFNTEEFLKLKERNAPLMPHNIYEPFKAQVVMYEYHTKLDFSANFSDMGTGKSAAMIWAADTRIKKGQVKKVLVVCPSSIMWNWKREINLHAPHLKSVICYHSNREKKLKLFDRHADIYITNYETIRVLEKDLEFYFGDDDMVILDEVHKIKDASASQTKACMRMFQTNIGYKIIATGTIVGNTLLDVHQPVLLLDKNIGLDPSYSTFRQRYFSQEGFKWYPKSGTKEMVQERIFRRAVRYLSKECQDLPPIIYHTRTTELSPEQKRLYDAIYNDMVGEFAEGNITAKNILSQMIKLSEITSGWVRNDLGKDAIFADSAKLNLLRETIEEIIDNHHDGSKPLKIIIWAKFIKDIENIRKLVGEEACVTLSGANSADVREVVDAFTKNPEVTFLIANPAVGGIGLNLTISPYTIYYSHSYSHLERSQSEKRNHRAGSEIHDRIMVFDLVCRNTVDETIVDALREKKELSSAIIDHFKYMPHLMLDDVKEVEALVREKALKKDQEAIRRITSPKQINIDTEEEFFRKNEPAPIIKFNLDNKPQPKKEVNITRQEAKPVLTEVKKEPKFTQPSGYAAVSEAECPMCTSNDISIEGSRKTCRMCETYWT